MKVKNNSFEKGKRYRINSSPVMRKSANSTFFDDQASSIFSSPVTIQPKLTIGQPNDIYEQEADVMADRVMSMPQKTSSVQAKCAKCEDEAHNQQSIKKQ